MNDTDTTGKEAGMGRVILCMGNTAKTPYVLKNLGISVYTIEELCYCIKEDAFLMNEEMVCRELIDWLRDECGLTELADSLYVFLRLKSSVSAFLTTILEYTGYYPPEEVKRVEQFLKASEGQDEYEKRKRVADYLAGTGKYQLAAEQYCELLVLLPEEYTEFRARILHNLGYVNCQMFSFEKAAEQFEAAYRLSGAKESLLQFLAAKRMQLPEKEYIDFIAKRAEEYYDVSMELEGKVEALAEQWKECRQAKELADIRLDESEQPEESLDVLEHVAEQLKERYRSMVREK